MVTAFFKHGGKVHSFIAGIFGIRSWESTWDFLADVGVSSNNSPCYKSEGRYPAACVAKGHSLLEPCGRELAAAALRAKRFVLSAGLGHLHERRDQLSLAVAGTHCWIMPGAERGSPFYKWRKK